MRFVIQWFWLLALFCSFTSLAVPSSGQLLKQAYEQRNQGVGQLWLLLQQIEANQSTLTEDEQAFYQYMQAYAFYAEGKTELAIQLLNQSIQSSSLRIQIFSNILLALSYDDIEAGLAQGFGYLFSAIELLSQTTDSELKASVYTVAATMHQTVHQNELARYYAEEGLKEATTRARRCMLSGFLIQLEPKPSESQLERVLEECQDEPMLALNARLWFAERIVNQRPQWVYDYLFPYRQAMRKEGTVLQDLTINTLLGESAIYLGALSDAEIYLTQAYNQARLFDDFKASSRILTSLALLYQKKGEPEKSAKFYRLAFENIEKQREVDLKNSIAYQVAKTNALQDKQKAESLAAKLELAQAENRAKNSYILSIILAVVLIAISINWFFYQRGIRFKKLSITDALTGVYNRRHFSAEVNALLNRPVTRNIHSLIIFDLDWFKKVNDTFGHAAGDLVLTEVCQAIRLLGRKGDLLARIGGEEFAFLLKDCLLEQAKVMAEQIRKTIEEIDFTKQYEGLEVTASLGVSSTELANNQFELLCKQADEALYQSKAEGRNRVTLFHPASDEVQES